MAQPAPVLRTPPRVSALPLQIRGDLKLVRCPRSLASTLVTNASPVEDSPWRARTLDHSHCPVLAPATLAALPSTRTIPDRTCSMSLIPFAPFAEAGARNGQLLARCCARAR